MKKFFFFAVLSTLSITARSEWLKCEVEVAKSSCWNQFDVDIALIDFATHKVMSVYHLPKSQKSVPAIKANFPCKPNQQVSFEAKFKPAIWQNQKGKVYRSIQIWQIPEKPASHEKMLSIKLCFSSEFEAVPLPITGDVSHCSCDFSRKASLAPLNKTLSIQPTSQKTE